MKQEIVCSKCLQSVDRILALECTHNLCLGCASKLVGRVAKTAAPNKSRLSNVECEICGVVSYLHPSAYDELVGVQTKTKSRVETMEKGMSELKKSRGGSIPSYLNFSPSKHKQQQSQPGIMLFCFSCQASCFTVDEYIGGLHKNHNVANTNKQQSIQTLAGLLQELNDKVRKRIEVGLRQSTKLTHRKRQLIEQLAKTKSSIRSAFQRIRQNLAMKQTQIMGDIEGWMSRRFSVVDGALQQVKVFTEKCENIEDSIRCYQQSIMHADPTKGFNFYSLRKKDILQQISQMVESVAGRVIHNAHNLLVNHQSLLEVAESIKRVRIRIYDEEAVESPSDNYFQSIKQQIFNQTTKRQNRYQHPSTNPDSLSKARSLGNLKLNDIDQQLKTLKKKQELGTTGQSRFKQRMRDLEFLLEKHNKQNGRSIRRHHPPPFE